MDISSLFNSASSNSAQLNVSYTDHTGFLGGAVQAKATFTFNLEYVDSTAKITTTSPVWFNNGTQVISLTSANTTSSESLAIPTGGFIPGQYDQALDISFTLLYASSSGCLVQITPTWNSSVLNNNGVTNPSALSTMYIKSGTYTAPQTTTTPTSTNSNPIINQILNNLNNLNDNTQPGMGEIIYDKQAQSQNNNTVTIQPYPVPANIPTTPTKFSVTGLITDPNSTPLSGVSISASSGDSTTTDSNGYYNLTVNASSANVTYSLSGYNSYVGSFTASTQNQVFTQNVILNPSSSSSTNNSQTNTSSSNTSSNSTGTGTATLSLVSQTNTSVTVKVSNIPYSTSPVTVTFTASNGLSSSVYAGFNSSCTATLSPFYTPGTYTISANYGIGQSISIGTSGTHITKESNYTTNSITVQMAGNTFTVSGVVTDQNGNPLNHVGVVSSTPPYGAGQGTFTNNNGYYSVQLTGTTGTITYTTAGYIPQSYTFNSLTQGTAITQNVVLKPLPVATPVYQNNNTNNQNNQSGQNNNTVTITPNSSQGTATQINTNTQTTTTQPTSTTTTTQSTTQPAPTITTTQSTTQPTSTTTATQAAPTPTLVYATGSTPNQSASTSSSSSNKTLWIIGGVAAVGIVAILLLTHKK